MGDSTPPDNAPNLDAVVNEVVAEAHLRPSDLKEEERAYLKEHALKKPLKVLDIWALGVGAVITGAYFGWNLGLADNGPVAMLVASLIVCLLYLTWVLALAELSVAMPFAGGPLAYGRRAFGPQVGFIMGWSMLLECQFATIATALAMGGYIAFLLSQVTSFNPDAIRITVALATVVVFFLLHFWGVKEQSWAMMVMTYGAILGLVIFWIAAASASNFSWERAWSMSILHQEGWKAVLRAVPYALWWLVIIETVALAAEEAHQPHRTIPRGLVWAQLTLIVLVVLTWFTACGSMDSQQLAFTLQPDGKRTDVDYPLVKALNDIPGRSPILLYGFGIIAIFGIVASFHGMVYGTSRQAFALGRAGYLPEILGRVHSVRRTPVIALFTCSVITAAFIIASIWWEDAATFAVLVSTLTALIWYILAMVCLFFLRRREPELFRDYRTPLYRVLPFMVVVLSGFAIIMFSIIKVQVIEPTILLYALGLGYYWFWARKRIQHAAPEELAARQAREETSP